MVSIVFEDDKNRATAYDAGVNIGESTFSRSDKLWIIDHTLVEDNYGGQGIAKKLVLEIIAQARNKGVKILPLCPFAKRVFESSSEYNDVLL